FLDPYSPMHGYHWPQLLRELDYAVVEPDLLLLTRMQSYGRGGGRNGVLPGAGNPSHTAWNAAFHQALSIWWMQGLSTASEPLGAPAVLPDGRPSASFRAAAAVTGKLGVGAGLLLAQAKQAAASVYV